MGFLQFASTWLWRGKCCIAERPSGCPSGWIPDPMLNEGFGELMLYFPWDVDTQHPRVSGGCCALLVRCVVISGDDAYSACNWGVLNRTEVVSRWASRWRYSPILLLHLGFWLCWRCTISHVFLQGGIQLHPCCYPAALRSWLWAFHVHGEIVFSCSFLSSDFSARSLCLMKSINATSLRLALLWCCSSGGV